MGIRAYYSLERPRTTSASAASEAAVRRISIIIYPPFLLEMNKEIKAMASELLHIQEKAAAASGVWPRRPQ